MAAVRPTAESGTSRCTLVRAAISTHGRPAPISALHTRAAASYGSARPPQPSANRAVPAAVNTRTGIRRSSGPATSPLRTEPAPWTAYSTPTYAGVRPRTSSATA